VTSNDLSVDAYVASLPDERTASDTHVLIEMMRRISGQEPTMSNVATIGFGSYHYKYASGKITVYLMDGTARYSDLLARLGRHTTSRVCVYIKRLSDVELTGDSF
jgi:hypothetical protein